MRDIRNHTGRSLLVFVLAMAVLLACTANAGWFDKKSDERPGLLKNYRFHRIPATNFVQGQLHQTSPRAWQLGTKELQLTESCVVMDEKGNTTKMVSGKTAIVSGTIVGNMIFATQVRMIKPEWATRGSSTEGKVIPSDNNSDVGEIKDSPM